LPPRTPHHAGLALSLGDVHIVERRVLERWKPRRSLRSQLALPDGQLVSGDVVNLSLGGFAARVERPIVAGTPIEVTLFDGNGAPVLFDIDAEVRRCAPDGSDWQIVSVSFRARGVVAMTVSRLR
jgi:PilZ domain